MHRKWNRKRTLSRLTPLLLSAMLFAGGTTVFAEEYQTISETAVDKTETINLNLDWRFTLSDPDQADFAGYDDSAWETVTLPHDWAVDHEFSKDNSSGTGYLPGGTGWYRKHFVLPENIEGRQVLITFNGVYKNSRVFVNSNYLGERPYGYSTFTYDISEFIHSGENVVSVRVEHEDIADSRWYTGSGIYRDVYLTVSDPINFEKNGIFVYTEEADTEKATIGVDFTTTGGTEAVFAVETLDGEVVAETSSAVGESKESKVSIEIPSPELWSPDSPSLYNLRAKLMNDGVQMDEQVQRFGIRIAEFDSQKGFFLNGENMKFKGVCFHHDAGTLGAAVPENVWRRRLEKLKEVGTNAIRTSHNPADPVLLDLCDEMGFLVMAEAFDEWEYPKKKWWQGHNVYPPKYEGYGYDFPQWGETDLADMILRDRNHPSIVLWSIGNEIDYPNDPYVHELFPEMVGNNDSGKPAEEFQYDPDKPNAERLLEIAKNLKAVVKEYDTTRPVTAAVAFPELSNVTGYSDILDIVGYNYKEYMYESDHENYPDRIFIGSETGHSTDSWRRVIENDYVSGQFLWTGIDFLGECGGWPYRISSGGLLNLGGFEKPRFYLHKSRWTEEPFAKITTGNMDEEGRFRDEVFAWYGEEGEEKTVRVYTNQAEAELFLNGESLGVQPAGIDNDFYATWTVPYEAGELKAVVDGGEDIVCTAGEGAKIELAGVEEKLSADGQDIWQVEIYLKDEQGNLVAAANDKKITVQVSGDAELLGLENGSPTDLTPYNANYRSTLDGRMIAYVRAGVQPDEIKLHAFTEDGIEAELTIQQN